MINYDRIPSADSARRSGVMAWGVLLAISLPFILVGRAAGTSIEAPPPVITYHCDSCGAEFDVKPPDPNDPSADSMAMDPMMGQRPIKCASCGKLNAWLMNRCYKCKKLFAAKPEEHKHDYDDSKLACPHCGTNQIQYLKEQIGNTSSTPGTKAMVVVAVSIFGTLLAIVVILVIRDGRPGRDKHTKS